ncbi:phosphoglucomutase, cytoplasmic [Nicotiana attenuata]|uniref:phosphoglucomutase (alpha-D-glucose-1,6-bisphosphate-dependent) n=1 Tax=Nicotiana attenuata TaxID=49451 RepID=A0A1J6I6H5_NICAT|nr:phosphoglucomutase, cytoplasmic [Nicotiana attenuata]
MVAFKVTRVGTTPFDGQKPGTSGLRKKVKVFTQPHYLQNFVQATFNALGSDKVKGATLVVSGDGRYFSKDAIQIITKMAAANGVRRVWVGQHGLMSTPAVSAVVRDRVGADGSKANGAFILTASHNPGGPHEDFGVKYNMENGGPAPEGVTNKIYENTTTIKEYLIAEGLPDVDISKTGVSSFEGPDGKFDVDVFDSTIDYVKLMKSIFDFPSIQKLLSSPKFGFCYDALHGVAGYYAKRIFVEELGGKESSLLNCVPKEDFGGGHPDPNLTYAKELVARMGLSKSHSEPNPPEFGAAADGDADRNMILGKRFFVTPSDSVAIIAANAVEAIPYFSGGLKGVASLVLLDHESWTQALLITSLDAFISHYAFISFLSSISIPKSTGEALSHPGWRQAMSDEMSALHTSGTWELVPLPSGKSTVGCRWVYAVKVGPNGQIDRLKACLVAKGYTQIFGLDYSDTFSPVPKVASVRLFLSMVVGESRGLVCRLRRSLYGLKQSSRAWFGKFNTVIQEFGMTRSEADHSVFYRHSASSILEKTGMIGCRPVDTPMDSNSKLLPGQGEPLSDSASYRRLVVVRIIRYIKSAPGKGLLFEDRGHEQIVGYSDADWAGSLCDRRSTSGYCVLVEGNLVSWKSKKQNMVARSSAEAKCRAILWQHVS